MQKLHCYLIVKLSTQNKRNKWKSIGGANGDNESVEVLPTVRPRKANGRLCNII